MLSQKYRSPRGQINFILQGSNPHILFTSGTHGDESDVIEPITKLITKYSNHLPDYLFIPQVSPSAVANKTRTNSENLDLNRNFVNHSNSLEARSVMELLSKYSFTDSYSFHEDPDYFDFYLYDIGPTPLPDMIINNLSSMVRASGISLLNGYDDENDHQLKYVFKDGYRFFPVTDPAQNANGMLSEWMFTEKLLSRRFITFEIPGRLPLSQKTQLTKLIFTHLILPLHPRAI